MTHLDPIAHNFYYTGTHVTHIPDQTSTVNNQRVR